MASRTTWREAAGRAEGPEGYQFGDVLRHLWQKISGGQGADASVDDTDRALLDLKVQRDQLLGHRRRADQQVQRDGEAARELVQAGRRELAMLALRKRRQHEQMAVDCGTHLGKLEQLIESVEAARVQREVVEALAAGAVVLRKVQQEIGGVDAVQRLMDEVQDAQAAQREIQDALSAAGVAVDDAEALAELARLEEAHAAAVLASAGPLPAQPVGAAASLALASSGNMSQAPTTAATQAPPKVHVPA